MHARAAYVLAFLAILGAGCPSGTDEGGGGEEETLVIEGRVYASVSCLGQTCTQAGPAVAGAVVSTSLDGQTGTTDAAGHFELKSGSTPRGCQMYTITIRASGYSTYAMTRPWGLHPTNQLFGFSPPFPDGTNLQCG